MKDVREKGSPKGTERGRRTPLRLNALMNSGGTVAYYAAVVVTTPVAIHFLGEERWGIWQLVGAATSYAVLLNLGLSSAVAYHVSRNAAVQDWAQLGMAVNNARLYLSAAALLLAALLWIGGEPLVDSLVGSESRTVAYATLVASVGLTAFTLPIRLFLSVISGLQRYDILAVSRVVSGLLLIASILAGFHLGMGLVGFAVVMTCVPVFPAVVAWLASIRMLPRGSLRWSRADLPLLGEMVRYSLNTLAYTAGTVVLFQSMKFIASLRCGGAAAAGHIGLVISVAQMLSVVFIPLAGVIHTRVSDLHGRGLGEQLAPLLRRSLMATGLVAVPTVMFLTVEAPALFRAWVGSDLEPSVIDHMSGALRLMMVGQGLYVVLLPCFYALLGLGRHRVFGLGMLSVAILNAVLGWFVTGAYPRLESLGLVFGVCMALLMLLVVLPLALRNFRLQPASVLADSLLIPSAAVIPGVLVLAYRPQLSNAFLDLMFAAIAFGLSSMPGLLLAHRRMGRATV